VKAFDYFSDSFFPRNFSNIHQRFSFFIHYRETVRVIIITTTQQAVGQRLSAAVPGLVLALVLPAAAQAVVVAAPLAMMDTSPHR